MINANLLLTSMAVVLSLRASAVAGESMPHDGLRVSVGASGIQALSYAGRRYCHGGAAGETALHNWPKRIDPSGVEHNLSDVPTAIRQIDGTIERDFAWGRLSTSYTSTASELVIALTLHNDSPDAVRTNIHLLTLGFPSRPLASMVDVGMWGNGGDGVLGDYPIVVGPPLQPATIAIRSSDLRLWYLLLDGDDGAGISIPYAIGKASYPLCASFGTVAARTSRSAKVSLRFAPPGSGSELFAGAKDALDRFAARHPQSLTWPDRRPVGMLFLASMGVAGKALEGNPSRWAMLGHDGGSIDVRTTEGRLRFQAELLRFADKCVALLKKSGAQGMITWDPEGQRNGDVYFGDPTQIATLSPEMIEPVSAAIAGQEASHGIPLIDAYFRKFALAGLRSGTCIRPQRLAMSADGVPVQHDTKDEAAYVQLHAKITCARQRWGCSLFYIDSTIDATSALDPRIFLRLAADFPDVLLMPENQSTLSYAGCAPLDSFYHQGVTRTPDKIREVWKDAFSVIMMPGGSVMNGEQSVPPEERTRRRQEIMLGMSRGDIYLFSGWYENEGTKELLELYHQAKDAPRR